MLNKKRFVNYGLACLFTKLVQRVVGGQVELLELFRRKQFPQGEHYGLGVVKAGQVPRLEHESRRNDGIPVLVEGHVTRVVAVGRQELLKVMRVGLRPQKKTHIVSEEDR